MRKIIFALLVAALALVAIVAAGTGGASTKAPTSAANVLVKCGKTRTLGFMAPVTGPAADIGLEQVAWAKYFVARYNRTHSKKLKLQTEDTMLGAPTGTAEALKGAQALAGNANVLALAGPAGSNEIIGVTKTLKDAGLAWVSGSSTRTTLTTDGTRTGFMFRTVPPDAIQGTTAASYILNTLKAKRVYIIDDQEAYSTGLAETVQTKLKAAGVSVTRDGFGQQMKQAGKGNIKLMGADGLYSDDFASVGTNVYATNFPVNPNSGIMKAFKKSHGGQGYYFGAPTYAAVQVVATAYDKACANGTASRAELRKDIRATRIPASRSVIGVALRFNKNGDLSTAHKFGIYKSNGKTFNPIG